jgi:DNA invertase Pin-like site-specific DNA recombinase
MKIIAYLRVSKNEQDTNNQKLGILEYCRQHGLRVDEYIAVEMSSRKSEKLRRIDELKSKLTAGDVLICSEMSRLGRSTVDVLSLVNLLIEQEVRIIVVKQNMDITEHDQMSKVLVTLFSLFAELERDLISARTKEALQSKKASGQVLGKPAGTIQKSKYDASADKIRELLGYGLSVRKIAKVLSYGNHISLNTYINKRGLRDAADGKQRVSVPAA